MLTNLLTNLQAVGNRDENAGAAGPGRGKRLIAPATLASALSSLALIMLQAQACPCTDVALPASLDKDPDVLAGVRFSHTSEFTSEFARAVASARAACAKELGKPNLAIVSDIDETLLDNREYYAAHPDFHWHEFTEWINSGKAPTLKPTADLLSWARSHGIAIFLITGRYEKLRPGTIRNLVKRGVAYDGLYLRPNGDKTDAVEYKSNIRKNIENMGFKIIVNIGDQYSDLLGGYAQECAKVPNRMYYIP